MSTKSRSRAIRRHPELANPEVSQAIGSSILSLVTMGMVDAQRDDRDTASTREPPTAPETPRAKK